MKPGKRPTKLLFYSLWAFFISCNTLPAADLPAAPVDRLITSGGYIVTSKGKTIIEYNADKLFIPASTIKLATALVALEVLGPTYRFKTEFYLKENSILYIKGYGDPFLTSEYIADIALTLKDRGLQTVSEIVFDLSHYALSSPADGSENTPNPYDVPNGALAVNFNALPLWKHKNNTIVSGEPQTPLIPLMQRIGAKLAPGYHRINVSSFPPENEINNSLRYAGELFSSFLKSAGVRVLGSFRLGKTDQLATPLYTYLSGKTVTDLVRDCLQYSSNFIANQLFLNIGAQIFGPPATWEKGREAMKETLTEKFKLNLNNLRLSEGSGLSRRNRMTPSFLLSVLQAFTKHAALLQKKNGILLKSGTLTDVYCYAGFLLQGQKTEPFVIMLNQPENTRKEVLNLIQQINKNNQ